MFTNFITSCIRQSLSILILKMFFFLVCKWTHHNLYCLLFKHHGRQPSLLQIQTFLLVFLLFPIIQFLNNKTSHSVKYFLFILLNLWNLSYDQWIFLPPIGFWYYSGPNFAENTTYILTLYSNNKNQDLDELQQFAKFRMYLDIILV